jgi:hypothetical protein
LSTIGFESDKYFEWAFALVSAAAGIANECSVAPADEDEDDDDEDDDEDEAASASAPAAADDSGRITGVRVRSRSEQTPLVDCCPRTINREVEA